MTKGIIAERLSFLRKHLSERLGEDLTAQELGEKTGLDRYSIRRMEVNLTGSAETLMTLLRFYRNKGYNTDWVLEEDNQRVPIIMPVGRDLLVINETLARLKHCLDTEQQAFTTQLRELGYRSFEALLPEPGKADSLSNPPDPLSP